jgi:hypothetical protein
MLVVIQGTHKHIKKRATALNHAETARALSRAGAQD